MYLDSLEWKPPQPVEKDVFGDVRSAEEPTEPAGSTSIPIHLDLAEEEYVLPDISKKAGPSSKRPAPPREKGCLLQPRPDGDFDLTIAAQTKKLNLPRDLRQLHPYDQVICQRAQQREDNDAIRNGWPTAVRPPKEAWSRLVERQAADARTRGAEITAQVDSWAGVTHGKVKYVPSAQATSPEPDDDRVGYRWSCRTIPLVVRSGRRTVSVHWGHYRPLTGT